MKVFRVHVKYTVYAYADVVASDAEWAEDSVAKYKLADFTNEEIETEFEYVETEYVGEPELD